MIATPDTLEELTDRLSALAYKAAETGVSLYSMTSENPRIERTLRQLENLLGQTERKLAKHSKTLRKLSGY